MTPTNKTVLGAAGITLIVVAGGAYWWWSHAPREPIVAPITRNPAAPASAPAGEVSSSAEQHPIAPVAPSEPLPALGDSDGYLRQKLAAAGGPAWLEWVPAERVARRFVATVDGLAREGVPVEMRAMKAAPGTLVVRGDEDSPVLAVENGERYEPYVRSLESLSAPAAAHAYREVYPLLQSAYEDLGYPNRSFNDRVVAVIDHLLATPSVREPIPLARPHVMYTYADPSLERRSAGQKLLLRIGSARADRVKAWLRAFRGEIAK